MDRPPATHRLHSFATALMFAALGWPASAAGQVVLDGTLRAENAGLIPDLSGDDEPARYEIGAELGLQHGGNLFHSFDAFSVPEGASATFHGPATIDSLISRVTGGSASQIDGALISTLPNADFFLLNPNGVLFGPNSSIDVQASFHASSADYLLLGEDGRFDARQPANSILVSAPPSAFGFLGDKAAGQGRLEVKSGALRDIERGAVYDDMDLRLQGLEIPEGEVFSLVGEGITVSGGKIGKVDANDPAEEGYEDGDLRLTGGAIWAPAGEIALISIGSVGEVAVPTFGVAPAQDSAIADGPIVVKGVATLSVSGKESEGAGSVHLRGGALNLDEGAIIIAENRDADGGEVSLVGSKRIDLGSSLLISRTTGDGRSADVALKSPKITFLRHSRVEAHSTAGSAGDVGTIDLESKQVLMSRQVDRGAVNHNEVTNDEERFATGLSSLVLGTGRGGDIRVDVGDGNLEIRSIGAVPAFAGIRSRASESGQGGTIDIRAGRIQLSENGSIQTFVGSLATEAASGGDVHLTAPEILIAGSNGRSERSEILSRTEGPGAGGAIHIDAGEGSLQILDGGSIETATDTESLDAGGFAVGGPGGAIDVEAGTVVMARKGEIQSTTQTVNPGGAIAVTADRVEMRGGDLPGFENQITGISSTARHAGNAGDVVIDAADLALRNGAAATTASLLLGEAGALAVRADRVTVEDGSIIDSSAVLFGPGGALDIDATESVRVIGRDASGSPSRIGSFTATYGDAGDVTIRTPLLEIDGGLVSTTTAGLSNLPVGDLINAGFGVPVVAPDADVTEVLQNELLVVPFIKASLVLGGAVEEAAAFDPAALTDGNAGSIDLSVGTLSLTNGGQVDASSTSSGNAGTVSVVSTDRITVQGDESGIFSRPGGGGEGGGLEISAPTVELLEGGSISIEEGNDVVDTDRLLGGIRSVANDFLTGVGNIFGGNEIPIELADLLDPARAEVALSNRAGGFAPNAGTVAIAVERLDVDGGRVAAGALNTSGGNVTIAAAQSIDVRNGGAIDASVTSGSGGGITIDAGDVLEMGPGGVISASATQGAGGNVSARASQRIRIVNGRIVANASQGAGGNVALVAGQSLDLVGGEISARTDEGTGGNIEIQASDRVALDNGTIIASVGSGSGGNIVIDPKLVLLENGSQIVAQAGQGAGGNIQITADVFLASLDSIVSASADVGIDGTVEINAPDTDLAGTLNALPATYLDAASMIRTACAARASETVSSFVERRREGLPRGPDAPIRITQRIEESDGEPSPIAGDGDEGAGREIAWAEICPEPLVQP